MDDDLLLMQRIRDDDDSALTELVRRWQAPVLAYICRFLGCDEGEANDIAQEVFLRVWRNRDRFEPRGRFSGWLFTIVANLCRNRQRDIARRPSLVSFDAGAGTDPPGPPDVDPLLRAEARALEKRVAGALADIPEKQRAAILLRRFLHLSYREIGTILDLTPGAVDGLLTRARENLLKKIRPDAQKTTPDGVHGGNGDDRV